MSGEDQPPPLEDFDARLKKARELRRPAAGDGPDRDAGGMRGLGVAIRLAIEMVTALAVGVGVGVLLDRWLGTQPWLMIVFFFLGAAAGGLNVYRQVAGFGYAAGYRRESEAAKDAKDDR